MRGEKANEREKEGCEGKEMSGERRGTKGERAGTDQFREWAGQVGMVGREGAWRVCVCVVIERHPTATDGTRTLANSWDGKTALSSLQPHVLCVGVGVGYGVGVSLSRVESHRRPEITWQCYLCATTMGESLSCVEYGSLMISTLCLYCYSHD